VGTVRVTGLATTAGKGKAVQGGAAAAQGQGKGKNKASAAAVTGAPAGVECFKCGREGHFQSVCTFDLLCILCSGEGHTSANCPTRGKQLRLMTMGHAITGGGFYNIDVEPIRGGPRPGEVFVAAIRFKKTRCQSCRWWTN
jgi:hypothetical protein